MSAGALAEVARELGGPMYPSWQVPAGALAEVARELGAHMAPYVSKVAPMVLRELRCDSSDNRRNAAFAAGALVAAAPEATSQHALNLLQVPPSP